jgi:NADH-quinone oxidoreductase subunit F
VPGIVANGAEWFKRLAANPEGAGNKLFGGSGALERPACIERPIGTPLRQLIDEMGGVKDGKKLLAVIPGGASTPFLAADQIDVAMDYTPLEKVGSRLGTGTFIVFGEDDCPVKGTLNMQRFFARESCGFCTPCRDGLPVGVEILERIENGRGSKADIDQLDELYAFIGPNSFCALAGGAAEPIKGLIHHFRPLLEEHVTHKGCPCRGSREPAHA